MRLRAGRLDLFLSGFGFSLNFGYWGNVIFRKMSFVIAFGAVRLFGIGPSHACFCHEASILSKKMGNTGGISPP